MQIDTSHVDNDIDKQLESDDAEFVAIKIIHFEEYDFLQLQKSGFLDKLKSSKQGLWELKIKSRMPVRLLCRYAGGVLIALRCLVKKRDGNIPQAEINKADKKAIECQLVCNNNHF